MDQALKLPHLVIEDSAIVLAGVMANWGLFGVLLLQIYLYIISFPSDRSFLKAIVYFTLFLETAQTVLVTHDSFKFYAVGFVDPILIDEVSTGWFSVPVMTGIIASLTQFFYCYRIGVIAKSKYAVTVISVFSLLQLGGAIGIGIETKRARFFSRVFLSRASFIATGIWDAGSAVCDLLIAGIMTHHLRKRDTGFSNTHHLISRIIRLTIETGSATAALALIVMILAFLPGHPPYYQAFALVLGKVYSNSMMAALNSRIKVVPNCYAVTWNESKTSKVHGMSTEGDISFLRRRDFLSEPTIVDSVNWS